MLNLALQLSQQDLTFGAFDLGENNDVNILNGSRSISILGNLLRFCCRAFSMFEKGKKLMIGETFPDWNRPAFSQSAEPAIAEFWFDDLDFKKAVVEKIDFCLQTNTRLFWSLENEAAALAYCDVFKPSGEQKHRPIAEANQEVRLLIRFRTIRVRSTLI